MNKFLAFAALIACTYGVPVPQTEAEREGRHILLVQQFPSSPVVPEAFAAQQDPGFVNVGVSSQLLNWQGGNFAYVIPGFSAVASNSNGTNYYINDAAAAPYAYPHYPQAAMSYPIFRRLPALQPQYVVPVAPVQQNPSDAVEPQADADALLAATSSDAIPSAAADQQVQGRFFTVQVPSDLSSFSITKPSLVNWASTGTTSGVSISGISSLSTTNQAAVLAALAGSSGVSVDNSGNIYISGK